LPSNGPDAGSANACWTAVTRGTGTVAVLWDRTSAIHDTSRTLTATAAAGRAAAA
jgi:hypothetical protein